MQTLCQPKCEKTALQAAILLACAVPILAGGAGMIMGTDLFSGQPDPVLNNHFRYLSGLLFAIGLAFLSSVPKIETHKTRVQLLTFLVVVGGLARLGGLLASDPIDLPSLLALGMELVVTPLLCLWQNRIARRYGL